jgi:hypothetical protein
MHRVFALLILSSVFCVSAFAAEISGMYFRENGMSYILSPDKRVRFLVVTVTDESTQAVSQLSSSDLIYGTGEYHGKTFFLNSVDVVGLHRLLGTWNSLHTQLEFLNFNFVNVKKLLQQVPQLPLKQTLHYVVTPGPEKSSWRVFFSDEESVTLASLVLKGRHAIFEFFDENTGEVIDRITLKKQ